MFVCMIYMCWLGDKCLWCFYFFFFLVMRGGYCLLCVGGNENIGKTFFPFCFACVLVNSHSSHDGMKCKEMNVPWHF